MARHLTPAKDAPQKVESLDREDRALANSAAKLLTRWASIFQRMVGDLSDSFKPQLLSAMVRARNQQALSYSMFQRIAAR